MDNPEPISSQQEAPILKNNLDEDIARNKTALDELEKMIVKFRDLDKSHSEFANKNVVYLLLGNSVGLITTAQFLSSAQAAIRSIPIALVFIFFALGVTAATVVLLKSYKEHLALSSRLRVPFARILGLTLDLIHEGTYLSFKKMGLPRRKGYETKAKAQLIRQLDDGVIENYEMLGDMGRIALKGDRWSNRLMFASSVCFLLAVWCGVWAIAHFILNKRQYVEQIFSSS